MTEPSPARRSGVSTAELERDVEGLQRAIRRLNERGIPAPNLKARLAQTEAELIRRIPEDRPEDGIQYVRNGNPRLLLGTEAL